MAASHARDFLGVATLFQSRVTNVQQLYALRFLVGMFEAPVFAGTHFILGKSGLILWISHLPTIRLAQKFSREGYEERIKS